MPPAAILDIDGTLVDTGFHHAVAWYRALRRHQIVLPIWRIHRHIGRGGDQPDRRALRRPDGGGEGDVLRGRRVHEPEPDLVGAALETAGNDAAVMAGDTTWDCGAAKRSGVPTVAVLTGGCSEAELRDAGAAVVHHS